MTTAASAFLTLIVVLGGTALCVFFVWAIAEMTRDIARRFR